MNKVFKIKLLFVVGAVFFALPFFVSAVSYSYGSKHDFYLDSEYDKLDREEVSATIRYVASHAYFYMEDEYWGDITVQERSNINGIFKDLAKEFDTRIYPILTSTYGSEWKPGIDSDYRITVLFQQMEEDAAGYFRPLDEYRKIQVPSSNEREMLYLSIRALESENTAAYLAHELTHLITFNQKDKRLEQEEDVWLNELRAEYSPTLLGYDEEYEDSNLQTRIRYFINSPTDSLTEWKQEERDYGVINIFAQYLVEQYGIEILSQSMSSPHIGVASLNYILNRAGIDKNLSQVFADWAVTIVLNDCSAGQEYCFQEEPLNDLRIAPSLLYLPSTQEASLSLVYAIKGWAAHWYKIVGGGKGLKVEFESLSDVGFIVPYFVQHANEVETVSFLELDQNGKGTINLPYFGENHQSLIIVPSVFQKTSGFSDKEPFSRFSLDISTFENNQDSQNGGNGEPIPISEMTVEQLKAKIVEIMAQIRVLLAELAKLKAEASDIPSGFSFYRDLGLNSSGNDVRYLQIMLNNDSATRLVLSGPGSPGYETSYFGPLTKGAVIRFQQKYFLDLNTGFVGSTTRQKLDSLLGK